MTKEKEKATESQEVSDNVSLLDIIRVAGKAGVSELKFGDLKLSFYPKERSARRAESPTESPDTVDPAEMGPTSTGSPGLSASPEDLRVKREFEEAQRMIDEPFAWETQQIDDQLGISEREGNENR